MRGMRSRCAVCAGHEIESDEVLDAGVLRLAECVRCGHRWTERTLVRALVTVYESADEVAVAA